MRRIGPGVPVALVLCSCLLGCGTTDDSNTAPTTLEHQVPHVTGYVLRPIGDDPQSLRFTPSREPIRDVYIDVKDGWRSIAGSKIGEDQIADYLTADMRLPVTERVRAPIGDYDFELRWKVGDVGSVNAALRRYGLEIVPAPDGAR
jgi:hypothetical protein